MPKFVGRRARAGTEQIQDNAGIDSVPGFVRLTYTQQLKLAPEDVVVSLDTTDRGSKGSYAKRWWRWFGRIEAVLACPDATSSMCAEAEYAQRAQSPMLPVQRWPLQLGAA